MKIFDFDDPASLDNNACYNITGLQKGIRNSPVRSTRVALAVFLAKMRLGLSNTVLASMFHFENKRTVSRIIHAAATALTRDFVPLYLGFRHIDRNAVLREHLARIATQLMTERDDQVIIVMDGTYLFVQNSSNNLFQRRSYSMHKHRNLIKPMIITATVNRSTIYVVLLNR
jgi:hypothetical protein